jgi:hypothetical protein
VVCRAHLSVLVCWAHLSVLVCWAHLSVLVCWAHLSVRHQKGLYPVVMALEGDPIGDGDGALRHLEAPSETLGEGVEQRPGHAAPSCRPWSSVSFGWSSWYC